MKVALLIHHLQIGGAESVVAQLARHLADDEIAVEVFCLDERGRLGERLRAEGIETIVLHRRPGFDVSVVWRLARLLRRRRIDVIHAHQRPALFYGILAGLLRPTPLLYTEHGIEDRVSFSKRIFNRLFGGRVNGVTAVSNAVADGLRDIDGLHGDIQIIPNGIDCNPAPAPPSQGRRRLRAFGIPARARVVGSVGRLHQVKNHQLLIQLVAELLPRYPDLHLAIAGEGPEREALEQSATRLAVAPHVHLLGARDDIPALLREFDVYVCSSRFEASPLALLEAQAARVPIVAPAVGGIGDMIASESEGLLVPCRSAADPSVSEFANAVGRLLDSPELGRALADRAHARVTREHGQEHMLESYRDCLRTIATRSF